MSKYGKEKNPAPRTKSSAHAIRGSEESLKLHSDPDCDRASEAESSGGQCERVGVGRAHGTGDLDRWRSEADGKVVDELIQATQDCLNATEAILGAGRAYLERLESIRASIKSSSDSQK